MLSIDASESAFICVRAEGILRWSDYAEFEPSLQAELGRRTKPLRLLMDLRGFRRWTAAGLIRDILFDLRHRASFSRIAVLGDARWHAWLTYLAIPVFRAKLRFFEAEEKSAKRWLGA